MKLFSFVLLTLISIGQGQANQNSGVLEDLKIKHGNDIFRILVESKISAPNPKGYCGAGEEITLGIYNEKNHKLLLSKLIESCLNNIELKEPITGNTVTRVNGNVDIRLNPIIIHWLFNKGKPNIVGTITLTNGTANYDERPSSP